MNLAKKNRFKNTLVLVLGLFIAGLITCSPLQVFAAEPTPTWGYGGENNPTRWGEISPNFAACELGRNQSPINIVDAVKGKPAQIDFKYNSTPLVVFNTGRTIQVNYASGSTATINGEEYQLLQFHFHTPSEHTISGNASPMELHLVHRNASGQLAVVGVMLQTGDVNPLIDEIWKVIPAAGETNTISDRTVNAANLLPQSNAYFSYTGSLTTPPCSEGVKWHVMVEPITVSAEQIAAFEKLYQVDARPLQPLNDRVIELHSK